MSCLESHRKRGNLLVTGLLENAERILTCFLCVVPPSSWISKVLISELLTREQCLVHQTILHRHPWVTLVMSECMTLWWYQAKSSNAEKPVHQEAGFTEVHLFQEDGDPLFQGGRQRPHSFSQLGSDTCKQVSISLIACVL